MCRKCAVRIEQNGVSSCPRKKLDVWRKTKNVEYNDDELRGTTHFKQEEKYRRNGVLYNGLCGYLHLVETKGSVMRIMDSDRSPFVP